MLWLCWLPCLQGCKYVQITANAPARESRCKSLCRLIQPLLLSPHNSRYMHIQHRACWSYVCLIGRPWSGTVIAAAYMVLGYVLHYCSCWVHIVAFMHCIVNTVARMYRAWTRHTEFVIYKFIWGDICQAYIHCYAYGLTSFIHEVPCKLTCPLHLYECMNEGAVE